MRRFIRHPANIPIEVTIANQPAACETLGTSDIGTGGLALRSNQSILPGETVHIKISYVHPEFETEARVVWCCKHKHGTVLGVVFLNPDDAFKARMVEQVCRIENYKHSVRRNEGRDLTIQEAATEWISKYAANFPGA